MSALTFTRRCLMLRQSLERAVQLSITVIVFCYCFVNVAQSHSHSAGSAPLLLISFDGFRWDYLNRTSTPNFQRIIKNGVHAKRGLKSVFVTRTIPNHWSMVTGLYPESHGMIDNNMFDPVLNETFVPKDQDPHHHNNPKFYDAGGEPIWVTNQLQNGRSGAIMWFGSENPVKWVAPTLQVQYENEAAFKARIDTAVSWFTSDYPINLGLVYFQEPDSTGHKFGPKSLNVAEMIGKLDDLVGYLLVKLEAEDLLDDLNIMITSDHGFTSVSKEKVIHLDHIVNPSWYEMIHDSSPTPLASIIPNKGKEEEVYHLFKEAAMKQNSHFKAFRKEDIPDRFHFKNNRRVTPIVLMAEFQYVFVSQLSVDNLTLAGGHGYDNENQDMHPFFVAMGPSFKKNFSVRTFDIIDIYPLMCELLGIHPAPNNGSLRVVSQLLEGSENTVWTFGTYILVLIVIASVGGIFSVAACRQHRYLKRKTLQLRLSPLESTVKYSTPSNGNSKERLLSDEDEDEFDDAVYYSDDHILTID